MWQIACTCNHKQKEVYKYQYYFFNKKSVIVPFQWYSLPFCWLLILLPTRIFHFLLNFLIIVTFSASTGSYK